MYNEKVKKFELYLIGDKTTPSPEALDGSCKARLHLCFWPRSYKLEVPMASSSLGSINSLEWLIKLRETFYSLGNRFVIKG